MVDSASSHPVVKLIQKPNVSEDDARRIAGEWIAANILMKKDVYRFGRAVMVFYPFWRYVREDGGELTTICKPACGTILHNIQTLVPQEDPVPLTTEKTLPVNVDAAYYYPELYGIPRKEDLVGIPFWLISYKYKNSIYMLKLDAQTGAVIPEWHPFKDPINWPKIAMLAGIPIFILSLCGTLLHPLFFLAIIIFVLVLLGYSRVLALLNTKREEGLDGS